MSDRPELRVFINERICEGCGDCGVQSNCVSVEPIDTLFGRKTRINQTSCNVDYRCLEGDCPAFMVVTPGRGRQAAPPVDVTGLPEPQLPAFDEVYTIRIVGIGGTGVVTVSQTLASAAIHDGLHVRCLDQTGLAQKGGTVVSDIVVSRDYSERSSRIGRGACDALLACDLISTSDSQILAVADPSHTSCVVSTSWVPTGPMVSDARFVAPDPAVIIERIESRVRTDRTMEFDARAVALEALGGDAGSNTVLLGAAFQLGLVPVSSSSIEWAIAEAGVAVAANIEAFRVGRRAALESGWNGLLEAAAHATARPGGVSSRWATKSLAEMVDFWATDLTDYQSAAYADRYRAFIDGVASAASAAGCSDLVPSVVARNLYKLMAYKDEYEVARLALLPQVDAAITHVFGEGTTAKWKLHPPVLRGVGVNRKLTLGRWFRPVLRVLASMRGLRGRRWDIFGHAEVRKVERALIGDYEQTVSTALALLTPATEAQIADLVGLPDMVRGFEDIKLRNVEEYRTLVAEGLARLSQPVASA